MDKRFIFVAYKPDSEDTCRGCQMASYSSDFIFQPNLTEDEVIEAWAKCVMFEGKVGEAGWDEIHVIPDTESSLNWWEGDDIAEERIRSLVKTRIDKIEQENEKRAEEERARKVEEGKAKRKKQLEEIDQREHKEWERLNAKYGKA